MKLRSITSKIAKTLKSKAFVSLAVLTLMGGIGYGAVQAEFYPDRKPFDYSVPCDAEDDNIYDRCGSLTGPVFNSFINTPSYGDERAFVDARRSDQTAAGSYENVLDNVNLGSQEVVIRAYVHNNANQGTNESGLGIAKNTTVRFDLPEATGNVLRARGYIDADNAALVEDTVDFRGTQNFSVEYIPGSAVMYNNKAFTNGVKLSDSIVTTGALIGDDALDGELPGCFEYEASVQIRVKITPEAPTDADLDFSKQVRIKGDSTWKEVVNAKPGDKVEWLMTTQVTGEGQMDNIVVRDQPAPSTELVSGTVKRIDASRNQTLQDGPLFDGGYDFGSYSAGSGFYTMFESTVLGDFEGCERRVRNQAFVSAKQQSNELKDVADVIITKENCEEPEEPIYSCDSLNIFKVDRDTFRFTINASASNGATIESYSINTGTEVVSSDDNVIEYTYAQAGNYSITATVYVNVDGEMKAVTSNNCKGKVKIDQPEEPIYECIAVKASLISENTFRFNTITRVDGGASVKHYVYNFGDGSEATVSENVIEHKYTKAGGYNITVTVVFNVNDEVRSVECATSVKIDKEVKTCPVPGKGHLPVDSADCYENCPIEGLTHLPKDDARCKTKETPTTPTTLPNTGAGSLVGVLVATSLIGAFAHRFALLRK